MNIIINTLLDVTIDGTPSGGVVDALFTAGAKGNEALRAPMLDALGAFCGQHADAIATLTAERDALKKTIADFLACDDAGKAQVLADAAKTAAEKERDAAQAKLDAAQAEVIAAQAELTAAVEKVEAKK